MAKNTSISLGSASEVVRAGLRLLEDNENKMTALRRMLAEGEQSGHAEYNYKAFIADLHKNMDVESTLTGDS